MICQSYVLAFQMCIVYASVGKTFNNITYLLPNQEDILAKTSSASHEELRSDAANIWDEEAAVRLRRDVRGSVVGELAVPVGPPFGQRVLSGWYFWGIYLPVSGLTL